MEPNKILSANILDLVFDNRNKEYGAYELRVTYPERVKRSLLVVFIIVGVAIGGAAIANSVKPRNEERIAYKEVTIQQIEEKKEVIPPTEKPKPQPVETKTIKVTVPQIVDDKDVKEPPPTKDEIEDAKISDITKDGVTDEGLAETKEIDKGTGIIETKKDEPDNTIYPIVQNPASYDGNWVKFLTQNLNAEIPVQNGAPAGRYSVIIQFVVDKQGNVSAITPLTNFGFGMEQEAVRVLKKAKKWKPGIQNGYEVNSYHKQPITFVVEDN